MPEDPLLRSVAIQLSACREIGAPFYAGLLERAHEDPDDAVPFWAMMATRQEGNPIADALPLRLLGAAHDLVLAGAAPELAAHYPGTDRAGDVTKAWTVLNATIESEWDFFASRLGDGLQTNEVRRCTALVAGFFEIHHRSGGLPMHLREIGASAGLNLCWDRHRYEFGDTHWGDPHAPLTLQTKWSGPPARPASLEILSRRGCDIAPIDLREEANRRRLRSFVWPEHPERMALLSRAIDVAAAQPIELVKQRAGDFVDAFLDEPAPGAVRVLYHSVMWVYVPEAERKHIAKAMNDAGARATPDAPLAWLRMEHATENRAALQLNYWPGGEQKPEVLAHCHYHGLGIEWFADASQHEDAHR